MYQIANFLVIWGNRHLSLNPFGGNIGIGTTEAVSRLTVVGDGSAPEATVVATGPQSITIFGNGNAYFQGRDTTNDIEFLMGTSVSGNRVIAGSMTASDFQLRTGNTGRMTINHDTGHVGIGLTTATERLHVSGNVLVSGTVTDSSDIRLKKNVKPLESALEKIMSLTGMSYDWITPEDHGGDRRQIGLIAQEVEVVFPEAVRSDSKGMLSVAYAKLIAPLIEAFKELVFRVDKNERSIASAQETLLDYKEKINRLESENQALKEAVCEINPSSQICVIQND